MSALKKTESSLGMESDRSGIRVKVNGKKKKKMRRKGSFKGEQEMGKRTEASGN